MGADARDIGIIRQYRDDKYLPVDEILVSPALFRHEDLIKALTSAGSIEKGKLTNILNHIHFMAGQVYVLLRHPVYEDGILVKASPEPCMGDELTCHWDKKYASYNLERYHFQYLVLVHEQSVIVVPAAMLVINDEELIVKLPEKSHVISERQTPRFACRGIKAELFQSGFQAEGEMLDFGPDAFRIRVRSAPPSSFHWFNPEAPATIRLSNEGGVFFSGNCRCLHHNQDNNGGEIVLVPLQDQIKRFPTRVLRNPRRRPSPPFSAVFEHPFFEKKVQREIYDISTSGFSICAKSGEVLMIPGMIIPEMTVVYAGLLKIRCKAQVIYRKEEENQIRFGIAMLDMDLTNYNNLVQILSSLSGAEAGMANEIDLDELWEFFFDTGFIYPKKYKHIQSFKNRFHEVYRRLYEEAPEIAKHFTYQDNGRIYGHISMLRAYERTWMVHHHAARPMGGRPLGLVVLKQLIYYLNDLRRLPSSYMDYVITYFRPGNKFPGRIFGGFAEEEANPQHCSLDRFTYLTYPTGTRSGPLPGGWSLRECSPADLWEFEQFYKHYSGGLFWRVLNPRDSQKHGFLEKVYAETGFTRRWKFFALTGVGNLKAFIVAEESDAGINLSDLLNGFKVFVMDPLLPPEILFTAVGNLARQYPQESFPLLIYPDDYANEEFMRYERKQYCLWILDMQYGSEYLEYLGRKFRIRFA